MSFQLDYDNAIHLDAEFLAEAGIGRRYTDFLPTLRQYVQQPATIEEIFNEDVFSYSLKYRDREFVIYRHGDDYESWTNATYAFFAIVNDQLAHSSFRFYAINGGNDLFGMFLTPTQAEEAKKTLPDKRDWPYIPTDEPPWYGKPG